MVFTHFKGPAWCEVREKTALHANQNQSFPVATAFITFLIKRSLTMSCDLLLQCTLTTNTGL